MQMESEKPKRLREFVRELQSGGRYSFSAQEAMTALKVSRKAFEKAARRLEIKRVLARPKRGFFAIVTPEYVNQGAPPAEWYIDELMKFQNARYYVGVLSAAAIHGASHQASQQFQVVTNRVFRPLHAGRSRVVFLVNKRIKTVSTVVKNTPTGTIIVSSPAATAFDLLRYVKVAAGLSNAATILKELSEQIKSADLAASGDSNEVIYVQRVGYLLDQIGCGKLTRQLHKRLRKRKYQFRLLSTDTGTPKKGKRNEKWKIIVNESLEVEV